MVLIYLFKGRKGRTVPFFYLYKFTSHFFIFIIYTTDMIYIQKGQVNTLVLNINNNARATFSGYTLTFTHTMSQEVKSYTVDTNNPSEYGQNIRYCEVVLYLNNDDLNYEGEYTLEIYGNGIEKVFTGIAILEGTEETPLFTQYISPNEENENYIYIS